MSLDLEIQALLRSPQVQEINFTMRGIRVTGMGFAELANCFSDHTISHRIRVTVRAELVGHRNLAVYNSDTDHINLRSNTVLQTALGRSHVVHECTHAQLDLRRLSTPIRSEEGAAFIAQAWYLLASGVSNVEIDRAVGSECSAVPYLSNTSIFPVSDAEQLKTSDDQKNLPIISASGAYSRFVSPETSGKNRFY